MRYVEIPTRILNAKKPLSTNILSGHSYPDNVIIIYSALDSRMGFAEKTRITAADDDNDGGGAPILMGFLAAPLSRRDSPKAQDDATS